ncbi:MAG: sensor histidine kinase [Sarcina sp.]
MNYTKNISKLNSKKPILKCILLALILWNLISKSGSPISAILVVLILLTLVFEIASTYNLPLPIKYTVKYLVLIFIFTTMYFDYTSTLIYAYIYVLTYLAIYEERKKETYFYIGMLFLGFFLIITFRDFPYVSLQAYMNHIYAYILPYLVSFGFILLGYNRRTSKQEISKLNEELTIQNKKLQEYATQIEDLTLSNERTRVAQELHDSLGHYLMAISMHLDILKKLNSSSEKSAELLDKTKGIVKESIQELRNTVFKLKKMKNSTVLSTSIKELAKITAPLSEVEFNIDIDKQIEAFSPFIKSIIYKTVQESITNGIKHGKATKFDINLVVTTENINFSIKNFGIPPRDIIKSNGLKGISERISLARGTSSFNPLTDGFLVEATIPVRKEDIID